MKMDGEVAEGQVLLERHGRFQVVENYSHQHLPELGLYHDRSGSGEDAPAPPGFLQIYYLLQ